VPGTPGVTACVICCGPTSRRFALCFACRTVVSRLGVPLAPVMPAHLCPVPGALYTVLMGYKEAPVHEARRRFAARVCRLFADFFVTHRACLAEAIGVGIDLVVPVPSSSRPGRASLEACDGLSELSVSSVGPGATWAPRVLQRAEGGIVIGHMRPDAGAFAVPDPWRAIVRGARVLLLDDTYVSGARAQSAAASLRLRGARSVLIVPLGRVIRPERFASHAAFMEGRPGGGSGGSLGGEGHRPRCLVVKTGPVQTGPVQTSAVQTGAGNE
jgi:hypothetical protein